MKSMVQRTSLRIKLIPYQIIEIIVRIMIRTLICSRKADNTTKFMTMNHERTKKQLKRKAKQFGFLDQRYKA